MQSLGGTLVCRLTWQALSYSIRIVIVKLPYARVVGDINFVLDLFSRLFQRPRAAGELAFGPARLLIAHGRQGPPKPPPPHQRKFAIRSPTHNRHGRHNCSARRPALPRNRPEIDDAVADPQCVSLYSGELDCIEKCTLTGCLSLVDHSH